VLTKAEVCLRDSEVKEKHLNWTYLYGPSPINAILTPGNLFITLINHKAKLVPSIL
jgi:hypothetical protein